MTRTPLLALAAAVPLAACAALTAQLVAFEQRAAPVIVQACGVLHQAEASPLVKLAVAGGNIASGGVAGPIVASIESFGDAFCANGPPPTDVTTPEAQAAWLYGVVDKMLTAAGVVVR
jgi:hypothetical protein